MRPGGYGQLHRAKTWGCKQAEAFIFVMRWQGMEKVRHLYECYHSNRPVVNKQLPYH